ncbi:MAG: spore germination protein [Desulfurispora sp.]|uniref:spore germination protein n=1 Tax=Desulfurispora sp. TaxID=3014275 RepID=UPI00404A0C27
MSRRTRIIKPQPLSSLRQGKIKKQEQFQATSGENKAAQAVHNPQPAEMLPQPVQRELTANIQFLQQAFSNAPDFVLREIPLSGQCYNKLAIAYLDGMVDLDVVNRDILAPLVFAGEKALLCLEENPAVNTAKMKKSRQMPDVLTAILTGLAVLFVNGLEYAYIFDVITYPARPVGQPITESTIRGPQEGFTEVLRINITQIRRRIKDPDLKVNIYKVGQRTQTDVALFYVRDLTPPAYLQEIEKRLQTIQIDGVLDTGYLEQMIADHPNAVFPQALTVERPDRMVANLLEGRAALMVDGSPFALILPVSFWQLFQSPDDYYQRWIMSSFIRLLRLLAVLVALLLPATYISVVYFHYELIPQGLIIAIAQDRSRLPYGPLVEVLFMELTLEVLRETGLRIPGTLGPTISIVGGLVIGDAAVKADLVSPIMVIVVALTALSSLTIPSFDTAYGIRLLRFVFSILAALLGGFGMAVGVYMLTIYLSSMRSLTVPFWAPVMPLFYSDIRDTFIRAPWRLLSRRPDYLRPLDAIRQRVSRQERPSR